MRRAIDLTTGFIVDPAVSIGFHRALAHKGWSVLLPSSTAAPAGRRCSYIFDLEFGRAAPAAMRRARISSDRSSSIMARSSRR
jgi:hypothetical protein